MFVVMVFVTCLSYVCLEHTVI